MAMQRRFKVEHREVFPEGAFLKGAVEPVADFDSPRREDGSRVQAVDRDSGLLLWQAVILDADADASKKDTALSVKFAAKVQPVPPENTTSFPWTPVEFVGLTALAYVDDSGNRARIAWSFRAEDMVAPGSTATTASSNRNGAGDSGRGAGKDAA
jgi:hypothetical protein